MEYSFIKDLAPTVAITAILGYWHYKAVQSLSNNNSSIIEAMGVAHKEKTEAFLAESKSKDGVILDLVHNHLEKSNVVMEKLSATIAANTASNDKLSAVVTQSLNQK